MCECVCECMCVSACLSACVSACVSAYVSVRVTAYSSTFETHALKEALFRHIHREAVKGHTHLAGCAEERRHGTRGAPRTATLQKKKLNDTVPGSSHVVLILL